MGVQRWAVIGTGSISHRLVPDLLVCAGVEVAVVHSRDHRKASRFAADFGIPAWTDDYEAVLADGSIDVVYLATPFATHHTMAKDALLADKHVLVEKPMTTRAVDAAELFALAAARGRFLMEAMWTTFSPGFRRLHEEIQQGAIGEPRSLRAAFSLPLPSDAGSRWDLTRSGGALLDQGIYPIALARSVFGEPESIDATGVVRSDGLDLVEYITLGFGDGRFAQLMSGMVEFGDCSASVSGRAGWITLAPPFWASNELDIRAGDARTVFSEVTRIRLGRQGNGYTPMLHAVIEAIESGMIEHPLHSATDTVGLLRITDAVLALLRAGTTLSA